MRVYDRPTTRSLGDVALGDVAHGDGAGPRLPALPTAGATTAAMARRGDRRSLLSARWTFRTDLPAAEALAALERAMRASGLRGVRAEGHAVAGACWDPVPRPDGTRAELGMQARLFADPSGDPAAEHHVVLCKHGGRWSGALKRRVFATVQEAFEDGERPSVAL
jgi:hypothetical protein